MEIVHLHRADISLKQFHMLVPKGDLCYFPLRTFIEWNWEPQYS